MRRTLLAACVTFALLQSCQPSGPAGLSDADKAAILANSEAWEKAAQSADWPSLAATYTEDATFMPPNAAPVQGRANIQAWFEAFPPIQEVRATHTHVDGAGDVAYARGTYTLTLTTEGTPPIVDTGKFLEVLRRQADGSWRMSEDIFNSNLPLLPQP